MFGWHVHALLYKEKHSLEYKCISELRLVSKRQFLKLTGISAFGIGGKISYTSTSTFTWLHREFLSLILT